MRLPSILTAALALLGLPGEGRHQKATSNRFLEPWTQQDPENQAVVLDCDSNKDGIESEFANLRRNPEEVPGFYGKARDEYGKLMQPDDRNVFVLAKKPGSKACSEMEGMLLRIARDQGHRVYFQANDLQDVPLWPQSPKDSIQCLNSNPIFQNAIFSLLAYEATLKVAGHYHIQGISSLTIAEFMELQKHTETNFLHGQSPLGFLMEQNKTFMKDKSIILLDDLVRLSFQVAKSSMHKINDIIEGISNRCPEFGHEMVDQGLHPELDENGYITGFGAKQIRDVIYNLRSAAWALHVGMAHGQTAYIAIGRKHVENFLKCLTSVRALEILFTKLPELKL